MLSTRRKARWLLFFSVLLGTVTWLGFIYEVRSYERSLGEFVTTWTVRSGVPAFSPITPELLVPHQVPKRYAVGVAILTKEEIIGKIAAVQLEAGNLLTQAVLRSPDLGQYRAITLSEKARGVVSVDETIKEGDRVDILVAYREKDQEVARYLLTGVSVLRASGNQERSISLLVTQDDARQLVWVENFGKQIRIVRQG